MQAYCLTRNLNVAAALGTCGVPVGINRIQDSVSGKRITEFTLGTENVPNPADLAEPEQGPPTFGSTLRGPLRFKTSALLADLRSGTLAERDPTHPALLVLHALQARELYLTYMERGTRCRIQPHPSAAIAHLVPGQEPLAHQLPQLTVWRTADLALVSALTLVGIPVLSVEGARPHRRFVLPERGHTLTAGLQVHAPGLVTALRSGQLAAASPEHPVHWAILGLQNRLKLQRATDVHQEILLRNPHSSAWRRDMRSVLLPENATNKALDSARTHLRIP